MHNNGLVKFIAFFFTFVCVIQLSNTFFTNKIENEADLFSESTVNTDQDDFVIKRQVSKKLYLDSISNVDQLTFLPKILRPTYSTFKSKELKRGLDLQGGINVILQISVKDLSLIHI